MNHNKHIHDEDYDINIKLMVPLLSILVCTICLCATTWAWYTASVSTGVNTITSGVNVEIKATVEDLPADIQNGAFIVNSGKTLKLSFTGKEAENGYYALICIEDARDTPSGNSLFNILVNRVYAEGESFTPIKKRVYFGKEITKDISITNSHSTSKQVTVSVVWAEIDTDVNGNPSHKLNENLYPEYSDELIGESLVLQPSRSYITINYLDTEENPLPASVLGMETYGLRDNLEEEPAIISFETEESEFTVTAPEGYLLKKDDTFNEETDVPSRTYQIEPCEEIEINVICVKIEEEPAEVDNSNDNNSEPAEEATATYSYTINCVESDTNTVIKTFGGTSEVGEITIDIPDIDGYKPVDDDKVQINVSENVETNVFSIAYKKLYQYQVNYVDENDNVLDTVSGSTVNDQIEVEIKNFEYKELILAEGETSETLTRTLP